MNSSNEDFLTIINSLNNMIFWKDINGVYLGCNKSAAACVGLNDPQDIVGKTDYDLFPNSNVDLLREHDLMVVETKHQIVFEEKIISLNGEHLIHLCSKNPLYDKAGNIIGVVGSSFDITDRKKSEQLRIEKLQTEKEIAEKISRVVKSISSGIAHEMRTPLSIIAINIDRLQAELKKLLLGYSNIEQKNKIGNFADNIRFTIRNGSMVITMLLTKLQSIFNSKHIKLELKPYSVKHAIDSALKEYPFYKKENELITWSEKKNIDFTYMGDTLLTKHVLFNLIKNALRAIKEAEHGEIFISLNSDNQFNYLTFKDTASGIPAADLESIFQQFNSKTQGGSGLGLAFCKTIMQSYGGDIKVDSKEGEYTVFTLSFPK